jgi:Putative zinc-finger
MVVKCEDVWREVSNYLDGEVGPELRSALEEHVRGCKNCTAVMDGTRNIVQLYGDQRMIEVPLGFSRRLHQRLENNMGGTRRSFFGWMIATATAVLALGAFKVASSSVFAPPEQRSEHAHEGNHVPPDMMVIVAEDGKNFHVAGCPFIHDKLHVRTIPAHEAMQEGYTPCVRCMKKYLSEASISQPDGPTDIASSDAR